MDNDIEDNEEDIKDLITNLLSKTEYIEITQKIIWRLEDNDENFS